MPPALCALRDVLARLQCPDALAMWLVVAPFAMEQGWRALYKNVAPEKEDGDREMVRGPEWR